MLIGLSSLTRANYQIEPNVKNILERKKIKESTYDDFLKMSSAELINRFIEFYMASLSEVEKMNSFGYFQVTCNFELNLKPINLNIDRKGRGFELNFLQKSKFHIAWKSYIKNKLSPLEIALLEKYPDKGMQVIYLGYIATSRAKSLYPEESQYLGKGDAFRHAYWNALLVKYVGYDFAKVWATAHEMEYSTSWYGPYDKDGNFNIHNEDLIMDMLNNNIGRLIGYHNAYKEDSDIEKIIIKEIENGNLFKIRKMLIEGIVKSNL